MLRRLPTPNTPTWIERIRVRPMSAGWELMIFGAEWRNGNCGAIAMSGVARLKLWYTLA